MQSRGSALRDYRLSPALAGSIGARRAWTVSMISWLSIPCRYTDVTEVGVTQLALDDVQRDPLAGHLHSVGVTQLMGRKAPPHTCAFGQAPKLRPSCGA